MINDNVQETPGLVNVFIASYNRAHYLSQSVDSVLSQTYPNYHIIIVDDASTDGAADVARDYAKRYPGKITAICKEKNSGVGDSVNKALSMSKNGEFFAFHADDDLWAPDKLERQIAVFKQFPEVGLVHTDAILIDGDGHSTGTWFPDRYKVITSDIARHILLKGNFICGASVVVRTKSFRTFDFQLPREVNFLSDCFMWMVIATQFSIYYIELPLTYYRTSPSSVTITVHDRLWWETYIVKKLAYARFVGLQKLASPLEVRVHFSELLLCLSRNCAQKREYIWALRFLITGFLEYPDIVKVARTILSVIRTSFR